MVIIAKRNFTFNSIISVCAIFSISTSCRLEPVLTILHILSSVEHIAILCLCVCTEVGCEIDDRLAYLTFLCGDDDDTAGCLSTIDSSRRSVFQHVNLSDIIGINL